MELKDSIKQTRLSFVNEIIIFVLFILTGIIGRTVLVGMSIQPFPNFEIIMVCPLYSQNVCISLLVQLSAVF